MARHTGVVGRTEHQIRSSVVGELASRMGARRPVVAGSSVSEYNVAVVPVERGSFAVQERRAAAAGRRERVMAGRRV